MRTSIRVTLAILAVLVATGIAVVAYQAGLDAGIASSASTEVVRVVDGWRGPGFFPGFLFFPLFLVGFILLIRFALLPRAGHWHGPAGPWGHDPQARAAEWHRRQHGHLDDTTAATTGGTVKDSWPDRDG